MAKAYDGVTVVKYLYDGDHCIAEYDGNDVLLRQSIYRPGVDQPHSTPLRARSYRHAHVSVGMAPPLIGANSCRGRVPCLRWRKHASTAVTNARYAAGDGLGSVVALSDAAGETVQLCEYSVTYRRLAVRRHWAGIDKRPLIC